MKFFSLILAYSLAVVTSAGCVFVPNLAPAYRSKDVGDGDVPLKVGTATRADVLDRWGKPTFRSDHDRAFGYLFETKIGTSAGLRGGPCGLGGFGVHDEMDYNDVWLEFTERGVLKCCKKNLYRNNWDWWNGHSEDIDVIWRRFVRGVPDTLTEPHNAPQ